LDGTFEGLHAYTQICIALKCETAFSSRISKTKKKKITFQQYLATFTGICLLKVKFG